MGTVSAAELGKGTTLADDSGNQIAELQTIGEFGVTKADLDVTAHDSSGNAMDYLPGLAEGGELACTGNLKTGDTDGQMAAIVDCLAGTRQYYTLTLPNTALSTFVFLGYVKSYRINPQLKDVIKISLTFKIANQPVFTV
jgi:hypothetical protein